MSSSERVMHIKMCINFHTSREDKDGDAHKGWKFRKIWLIKLLST